MSKNDLVRELMVIYRKDLELEDRLCVGDSVRVTNKGTFFLAEGTILSIQDDGMVLVERARSHVRKFLHMCLNDFIAYRSLRRLFVFNWKD